MTLVYRTFKIIKEDTGLTTIFPELTVGTIIKVKKTLKDGITGLWLENGQVLDIHDRNNEDFWCFWVSSDMANELEEIEYSRDETRSFERLNGPRIIENLESLADELNEYNQHIVMDAADYIRELEKQLQFSDMAF